MAVFGSTNTTPLLQDTEFDEEDSSSRTSDIQGSLAQKPLFRRPEPNDNYFIAYFIFYLLGMTTLLPWNFFITADNYWMYKFRDVSLSDSKNFTNRTQLQAEFESYLSVASSVPTFVFYIITSAATQCISFQLRMIGSLLCMSVLFVLTTVLVNIDTDEWQDQFFLLTMATVVLLNISGTILGGTVFGIVGKFTPTYITAVVGGQALGGIFAAVAQIICLAIGASPSHSAFIYFVIGDVTIVVGLLAYVCLSKTFFFKFYMFGGTSRLNELESERLRPEIVSYRGILGKMWKYGASMTAVFAVSLAVFPGVTVLIESEGKAPGKVWNNKYFVPTINYLLYNVGDYVGRLLAGKVLKPKSGTLQLLGSLSRVVLVPFLLLCNAQPRHHLPVVFDKDYKYIIFLSIFSVTNGYFANLGTIFTPRVVDHHEKEVASTVMTVFLGLGLAVGSLVCMVLVKVI